ncbi:hypothetical protein [Microvirga sp. CF3016]|uniref:hypothetical protein n=1 Tax=Microvirga sp. CF3016 TaxID=3110181 RepID=UPI002E78C475|nr:hypothetical protein [Microvirga sp. CF3016]MEE1609808.1 hypothetical protein [Microvirga sp. CF3016]
MVTFLGASGSRQVLFAAACFGLSLSADATLARDATAGRAQDVGSKSAGAPTKRSGPARPPAPGPTRKADGAGNFVYGIINTIRTQSEELCARYGNPADCLEEAEVCLTMRDNDDNQVRLCLNTAPGDSGNPGSVQKSRLGR